MEAQRGCSLTKAEKRVFLQVIASLSLPKNNIAFYLSTTDLAKWKEVIFSNYICVLFTDD